MRLDFIDTLHCPYSGSRFGVHTILEESDSDVNYAIVTSEAGDFPIVDGILRLKMDEYRLPLVDLLKSRRPEQALLTALESPPGGRMSRAINALGRTAHKAGRHEIAGWLTALKKPMYRVLTDPTLTFTGAMNGLKTTTWAAWQIQRFSMPHFLPAYPLLHLLEGTGPVLDFGCGQGHASFLMSRRVPDSRITCADVLFYALYLTRHFFLKNANLICLDGDFPLPFDSGYFSFVFSSDVLHFVNSKLGLSQEFRRIAAERGAIMLPHLHNKLSPVRSGRALTPEGYTGLFAGMEQRILPEETMVAEFMTDDSLDLERRSTTQDLHGAVKGLSLVASRDSSLFRRYTGLWQRQTACIANPMVNPVYQASGGRGSWSLKKRAADGDGGKGVPGDNVYLPHTTSVPAPSLDSASLLALKASNPRTFGELARHFVLVDVPERFQ
jgi:SAM-dependent methyltransferase